jgi:hypothetical protein
MKVFLRVAIPIIIALAIIVGCIIYLNHDFTLNHGEYNVEYNGVTYERTLLDYNLDISEENAKYIGDYGEIYAYGQEYTWELRVLNSEANMLYTPHATFLKPGYSMPSPYGEDFVSAEYVVSEGIDFKGMPDDYTEKATLLATFDKSVKLEDIIESEPTEITISEEDLKECNEIRFKYKNHADIFVVLAIYNYEGDYYLDVRHAKDGTHNWFKIKPEYVDLLTSAM